MLPSNTDCWTKELCDRRRSGEVESEVEIISGAATYAPSMLMAVLVIPGGCTFFVILLANRQRKKEREQKSAQTAPSDTIGV